MRNRIIIIISMIVITISILGFVIWFYIDTKENKKIDAEAITLKENLTLEFGQEAKVSDFIANINGSIVNDHAINTEKLGDIQVSFDYINIKNKRRTSGFTIKITDKNAPQIFIGNSFTVNVGYNKNLADVLFSGDDIDNNPKREILGQYDLNVVGDYDLTYVVTDSSGNQSKKQFTLHVKEEGNKTTSVPKEPLYLSDVLNKYKTENTKIGIDVSKWQQEIDWQAVKNAGVEFVMIRMGYQTDFDGECVLDPYFISNIEGAKSAGLPVGVYFYSYAKNVNQVVLQAEWVKENLKNYKLDLPVAFDWESWNSFNTAGMSFYTINKVANTFLDNLEKSGYKGMLYSSKTYLEKIWYPTKYDTWLAQYNNEPTYTGKYSMWQMSNTGKVDGIKGDVDIDIMYLNNN
ncbi:MAG: hypothetical protein HFJ54_03655 [Clostridia bacterium]|nr:hypothetical protein [Clostridia bacterium]